MIILLPEKKTICISCFFCNNIRIKFERVSWKILYGATIGFMNFKYQKYDIHISHTTFYFLSLVSGKCLLIFLFN